MDIGTLTGTIALEDQFSRAMSVVADKVAESFKKITKANENSENSLVSSAVNIAKRFALVSTVVVGTMGAIVGAITAAGRQGSTLNDIEQSFDRLAESAGTTGAVLRGALSEGVRHTVDETDLMRSSMTLLQAGMRLTADDANLMGKAARELGKASGTDATHGLEMMSSALASGRVRSLQQKIGLIDLEAGQKKFADSLGVTVKQLNAAGQLEGKRIAILDATRAYLDRVGQSELSFKERVTQASLAITGWFDNLMKAIAASPRVNAALEAITTAFSRAFGAESKNLLDLIVQGVDAFADFIVGHRSEIESAFNAIREVIQKLWEVAQQAFPYIITGLGLVTDAFRYAYDIIKTTWGAIPDWVKTAAADIALAFAAIYAGSAALGGISWIWNKLDLLYLIFKQLTVIIPLVGASLGQYGLAATLSSLGIAVGGLMASPFFVAATFTAIVYAVWRVIDAFRDMRNAFLEGKTMWEFLSGRTLDEWAGFHTGFGAALNTETEAMRNQTKSLKELNDERLRAIGAVKELGPLEQGFSTNIKTGTFVGPLPPGELIAPPVDRSKTTGKGPVDKGRGGFTNPPEVDAEAEAYRKKLEEVNKAIERSRLSTSMLTEAQKAQIFTMQAAGQSAEQIAFKFSESLPKAMKISEKMDFVKDYEVIVKKFQDEHSKVLSTLALPAAMPLSQALQALGGDFEYMGKAATDMFAPIEGGYKIMNFGAKNARTETEQLIDVMQSFLGMGVRLQDQSEEGYVDYSATQDSLNELGGSLVDVGEEAERFNTIFADQGPTMEQAGFQAKKLGDSLKTNLLDNLKQFPSLVVNAFTGGGGLKGALVGGGSMIGATLGESIGKIATGEAAGKIVSGIGKLAGPLGAAIGSLAGPLIEKLFSIGGPSKKELEGRKVSEDFKSQFKDFDDMMGKVGAAYEATGQSSQQAQDDVKAMMDAEKMGATATAWAIEKIQNAIEGHAVREEFQKQFGEYDDMVAAVTESYSVIGVSAEQAKEDIKALTDAEKNGAEATVKARERIVKVMKEQEKISKEITNAISGVTSAFKAAGTYIPPTMIATINQLMKMNGLTKEQRELLQGVVDDAAPNYEQLTKMAEEYGITLDALGPKFKQMATESDAKKMFDNLQALIDAGADVGGVLAGAADEISKLVQDSIKFKTAIPDNMKPWIEELSKAGQLVDENGKLIKDISKIKFEDTPLDKGLDKLNLAIEHLADVLNRIPGLAEAAGNSLADMPQPPEVPEIRATDKDLGVVPAPMAKGGYGFAKGPMAFTTKGNEYFAFSGEGKKFPTMEIPDVLPTMSLPEMPPMKPPLREAPPMRPYPKEAPPMTPPTMMYTASGRNFSTAQPSSTESQGKGSQGTVIVELNGRRMAEILVPELPGAMRRLAVGH